MLNADEPGFDHPDMYEDDADEIGDCDDCGDANVPLFDLRYTTVCRSCRCEHEDDTAMGNYADHVTRRAEDGWRDA